MGFSEVYVAGGGAGERANVSHTFQAVWPVRVSNSPEAFRLDVPGRKDAADLLAS